jgi:hypothetical protein
LYVRHWIDLMAELHQITERGLLFLKDKPPELRERLEEAHELFSLLEERFPEILSELVALRNDRQAALRATIEGERA